MQAPTLRPTHITPIPIPPIHLRRKPSMQMPLINRKRNNNRISNIKRANPSPNLRHIPNTLMAEAKRSRHPLVRPPVDVQVRATDRCSGYLDDGVGLVDDGGFGEVDDADAVGVSLPDDGAHCGV